MILKIRNMPSPEETRETVRQAAREFLDRRVRVETPGEIAAVLVVKAILPPVRNRSRRERFRLREAGLSPSVPVFADSVVTVLNRY